YNFSNDSIDVEVIPKVKAIKEFIYKNKESYEKYLKARYTSYDGFMSHYDNDFTSWQTMTKNFTEFSVNGHVLGSILEFICIKENITENDLYEDIFSNMSLSDYISNLNTVGNPSCNQCHAII